MLVHCEAGTSRSPTIVVAYLMRKRGWGVEEALGYVGGRRKCVNPNKGFMKDLRNWQK